MSQSPTTTTITATRWPAIITMGCIQACMMSTLVGFFLIAGLIGKRYAVNPTWSTLPLAAFVAGVTIFVIPVSLWMARYGRRAGFALGAVGGMAGGVLIIASLHYQSFLTIVVGGFCIGIMMAATTYLRFAALEVAERKMHGRAASVVLSGGIIAALVGPHLGTALHAYADTGAYRSFGFTMIALNALAFLLTFAVRFGAPPPPPPIFSAPRRLLDAIKSLLRSPPFLRAAIASVSGFAVMSLAMNATPLTLTDVYGYPLVTAAFVMQNHLLGMFVPFIFSGYLLDRIGATKVVYAGFAVYILCFAILLNWDSIPAFHIGLILLGVGWNFTFLGGTTLLFAPALTNRAAIAQPLNEFWTNLGNFIAASLAGMMLYTAGWFSILTVGATAVMAMMIAFWWSNRLTHTPVEGE